MGRPAAISYEQVREFMNDRMVDGERLTIDQIWEAFGKKGSKGTIHGLIKRYRAESQAQETPASLRLLPPALQGAILAFADQTAHAAREAVAVQLLEYQQHADTLAGDNERLTAELAERDEVVKAAVSDAMQLEHKLALLEAELAAAREYGAEARAELGRATASLGRLEQQLEELANVKDQLQVSREQCEQERMARIGAEVAIADMRAQKMLHEQRAQDIAATLASVRAAYQKTDTRNGELDARLKCAERELADTQRELAVQCAMNAKPGRRPSKADREAAQGTLGLDRGGANSAG